MTSRRQEQRPYGSLQTENAQQYYNHAQASQFSLHTPTDPNPPNSSFRSPAGSPRNPSGQFPPSSPGFLQMEHQEPSSTVESHPLPRVFDGEESPVEHEQHEQVAQVEYANQLQGHDQQYQGHPHQHQSHEQQYQQSPTGYQEHHQGQEAQYQHPQTEYLHRHQSYDNQVRYSTPHPSPGLPPPSQFDSQSRVNGQRPRGLSQQYGPSPQYTSPQHSPSFPPPQHSPSFPPPQRSPSFPPPQRSPSFPPPQRSPSFPPPQRSPSFPPPSHSPSFPPPPHTPSFPPPPTSPSFPPPPTSPTFPLPPTPYTQRSSYTPHTPHTPTFPPPPTSEIYQSMHPNPPSPPHDLELTIVPHELPPPPEPIGTPAFSPGDLGPKTPVYTPGGASGPNGGVHAPGQIGHPNQQYGKEVYHHGLCDCFSNMSSCCIGYWCPCILYSRTNHRLKTSPNSNLNDFHSCNGHCMIFCALAPLSWIFTTIQRSRIRERYRLEGTVADDCGKAYCCVMCTLVQDDREVTHREDERRRFAGPGSGVVGDGGYRRETMVYG